MEEVLNKRKTEDQAGKQETIIPFLPTKQNPSKKASQSTAPSSCPLEMEKSGCRAVQLSISSAVLLLGMVAFSCCVAAEFTKSKATRDLKLDGSLCSLQRSSAFALGLTALACLSVAQIAGTSAAGARICAGTSRRRRRASIALLVLSWLSFGLAAILLGTASGMSNKQAYGRGWLDGDCYLVKDGVYIGSAILAVSTVIFILGFTLTATSWAELLPTRSTLPNEAGKSHLIQFPPKDSSGITVTGDARMTTGD